MSGVRVDTGYAATQPGSVERSAREAELVAGRYRLGERLGRGGHGEVFAARDELGEREVALKFLVPADVRGSFRHDRERIALRVLRVPGVAELLDEGVEDGRRFLVMERVHGERFPGSAVPSEWSTLAGPALGLLRVLHRVHESGIVHRDLKPANVLVDEDGHVRLLDFGLARGGDLDATVTSSGVVVGTYRYMAPEQLAGERADARADLYALGVMLFEALTGHAPHDANEADSFMQRRLFETPASLTAVAPEVDPGVAAVVDALLARSPEARPRSAAEAIARLRRITPGEGTYGLPRLGGEAPVRALVEAAEARRPLDLGGAPGTGRTRCLREAAEALRERGRTVEWTRPGERPFRSLRPLIDEGDLDGEDLGAVETVVRERLRERLRAGTILVADDAERLDRWSAACLEAVRDSGAILRVVDASARADVTLRPLTEAELRPLFHGPDRILHRREDGARALHQRSGGYPRRIAEVVSGWVVEGVARWRDGRLDVDPLALEPIEAPTPLPAHTDERRLARELNPGLEELLAWIALAAPHADAELLRALAGRQAWELEAELAELAELRAVERTGDGRFLPRIEASVLRRWNEEERRRAHATVAALVPEGGPGRLRHLIASGEPVGIADEAVVRSRRLRHRGRLQEAMALLRHALVALRRIEAEPVGHTPLATELVLAALAHETLPPLHEAAHELDRAGPDAAIGRLRALVDAALAAYRTPLDEARERTGALAPFDDLELDTWRQTLRFIAAQRAGGPATEQLLAELEPWAEARGGVARERHRRWLGLLRYRQGRFGEAARLHESTLEEASSRVARHSAMNNAALARLEAGEPDVAERYARTLAEEAARERLPRYELQATWLLRSIAYRRERALEPDPELAAAARVASAGVVLTVSIHWQEAIIAWRADRLETAQELVRIARAELGSSGPSETRLALETLHLVVVGPASMDACRRLVEEAQCEVHERIELQLLGLLAEAAPSWPPAWAQRARAIAARLDEPDPSRRLELLSIAEALDRAGRRRSPQSARPK